MPRSVAEDLQAEVCVVALLVPPRGLRQGGGSPADAGPLFGDGLFSSAGISSAFCTLETQAKFLQVTCVGLLLQLTNG